MRLITFNNTLEALLNDRLRMQKAFSAANSLMIQLHIPQGDHLLYVIGYPHARDNKDAISRWILDQDHAVFVSNEAYTKLKSDLRRLLVDSLEGNYE